MKNDNRFEVLMHEGSQLKDSGLIQIIVDKETGVNYLWVKSGYAGGLPPPAGCRRKAHCGTLILRLSPIRREPFSMR